MPLNQIYVTCIEHGETKICPATIMARMRKWTIPEIEGVLLEVIQKSIAHLRSIGELE